MNKNNSLTIEEIINQYSSYIYNLALKLSANPDKAGDLAQETFIKAWSHMADLRDNDAAKKWLRTICINEFRMMYRKEKRGSDHFIESVEELENEGELLIDPKPSIMDEILVAEEVANLRNGCFLAMTRKLTLNQRTVFSLIDMFGMSIHEVAMILDLSPKAVKGLLYRARMNLEAFFKGHCSLLDTSNPCRCTAWVEFMKDRNTLQDRLKRGNEYLDYKEKGYSHDPETSGKILQYYQNLPVQRPSEEWFDNVIRLLNRLPCK